MELPDLSRIVETYVIIDSLEEIQYYDQFRREVISEVRSLQRTNKIKWFCCLLHNSKNCNIGDMDDSQLCFHLRFEPSEHISIEDFIKSLPANFKFPKEKKLSQISGIDSMYLINNDWAQAWKIIGESSEWVFSLIEGHSGTSHMKHLGQFEHFYKNPLLLE